MKPMHAPDDEKLRTLLRGARPAPALPPRFQENVWRRIESSEAHKTPVAAPWLEVLAGWLMRPRLAFAVAVVLLLAGGGLGWNKGQELARHEAQARYVAAVAPGVLR